nr:hypothetical protein [Crateriforma spongiae]
MAYSIEKLVFGVKFGAANDQHRQAADGAMANPGRDQDGGVGANRMRGAVQFNRGVGVTFQDDVNLGVMPVVMCAGGVVDAGQVDGAREIVMFGECPPGDAAGAINSGQVRQVDDFGPSGLGWGGGRFQGG